MLEAYLAPAVFTGGCGFALVCIAEQLTLRGRAVYLGIVGFAALLWPLTWVALGALVLGVRRG